MADNFTPEQIEEFMQEFLTTVGRRQYIGARYVPIFGRIGEESIAWDNTAPYEPLTVVTYEGNSYTSRTYVPAGIDITNATYWALTGNYWAQIEQYRQEVAQYNGRITDLEDALPVTDFTEFNTVKKYIDDLGDIIPTSSFDDTNTVKKYIDDLGDIIPSDNFDDTNTVKKYIDDEIENLGNIIPTSSFDDTNTVKKYIDDLGDIIPSDNFDDTNTVKKYIDDEIENLGKIIPSNEFDDTNTVKKYIDDEFEAAYVQMLDYHKEAIMQRNHQGGFNIIGEFDLGDYGSVQGCTWIEGDNYIVGCSIDGTDNVYLFKWNSAAQTLSSPVLVNGYHDNSITYKPDTDELYICEAFYDANWNVLIPTITVVNYTSLTFVKRITVPVQDGAEGVYGLAYDRKEKIFYATLWRGTTDGRSNRIYKYDETLTEYLGFIDLDDFTSRYTKGSSNQGVQYVANGLLWEIYYDFGLIAAFDVTNGKRKILYNVPYFANNYRFVGELEGFAINETQNRAICFTASGAFECGIFHDVYEDKLLNATVNYTSSYTAASNTIRVQAVNPLDTTTSFVRGTLREIQDGFTLGSILNKYVKVQIMNQEAASAAKHTIYIVNFTGEFQLGSFSSHVNFTKGIKILGSNLIIWGANFSGKTNCPMDLGDTFNGNIVIYNSRVRVFGSSFSNPDSATYNIVACWNTILYLSNNGNSYTNGLMLNGGVIVAEDGGTSTKSGDGYVVV